MISLSRQRIPKQMNVVYAALLVSVIALILINAYSITRDPPLAQPESSNNKNRPSESSTGLSFSRDHPEVLSDDIIYTKGARSTFVIPEYKLIFFTFPKVACSEWKRMFMRINGNENWCKIRNFNAHDPKLNGIKVLSDYPTEIATAMLTSPSWTRAAIVREPKERVLSAFLDKAVKERNCDKGCYYITHCCNKISDEEDKEECIENGQDFKSFLTFVGKYPKKCMDVHWEAQMAKIDAKWWPYIDFIGYQNNLVEDAKTLLKTLTSTKDPIEGRTAWERYGKSGWGNDNELCEKRPHAFLEENTSTHKLETGSRLHEWYTPETEEMVEKQWAIEWEQEKVQFLKVELFPRGK
jgi:hypothetical protein